MSENQLVGCVVPDEDRRVYLVHRRDHMQWQLSGGRIQSKDYHSPLHAATRHAAEELNLRADYDFIKKIGETTFEQGGISYNCQWMQMAAYGGEPLLLDWGTYDDYGFFNLYTRSIGKLVLSPNVRNLVRDVQAGIVEIEPRVTVQ